MIFFKLVINKIEYEDAYNIFFYKYICIYNFLIINNLLIDKVYFK